MVFFLAHLQVLVVKRRKVFENIRLCALVLLRVATAIAVIGGRAGGRVGGSVGWVDGLVGEWIVKWVCRWMSGCVRGWLGGWAGVLVLNGWMGE